MASAARAYSMAVKANAKKLSLQTITKINIAFDPFAKDAATARYYVCVSDNMNQQGLFSGPSELLTSTVQRSESINLGHTLMLIHPTIPNNNLVVK